MTTMTVGGETTVTDAARMPLMAHLRELRRRLIIVMVIVAIGAAVSWYLYDPIIRVLEQPYCNINPKYRFDAAGGRCVLVYHGVLDGLSTRIKVTVLSGAVLTAPLWLYQVWAFIAPGLREKERRYAVAFIAASTSLFAAGVLLADFAVRKGLGVLLSQGGSSVQAMLTINGYLSFFTSMLLAFGLAFELPLVIVMANLAGVLRASWLRKTQRPAIFLIFLFAAVFTPSPDPLTMCLMAVPMVVLFEAAVLIATLHDRRAAERPVTESFEHVDS
jgi:sec-independent protein translocase protein TatC